MNIALKYLSWHYSKKTKQIIITIKNFLAFGAYFFSAKELFFSLFAPWKKQVEEPARGFDLGNYLQVASGNLIARVIGFLARTVFLIFFLIFESIIISVGVIAFLIWLLLPLLVIFGIIYGIKLILNYV